MATVTDSSASPRLRRPLPGSFVERHGWVLVAFLCLVMIAFGLMAFFSSPSPDTEIFGSKCCNGHRLSEAPTWVYDYTGEMARYMASYMAATGLFSLAVVVFALRRAARWAWAVCWAVPALFAVHAFVLGAFPFDAVTMTISAAGLLLMVRPVFAAPSDD